MSVSHAPIILFGERSPRPVLTGFAAHDHGERNHQGKVMRCSSLRRPTPLAEASAVANARRPAAVLLPGRMNILT
jgi:hypothetical protein